MKPFHLVWGCTNLLRPATVRSDIFGWHTPKRSARRFEANWVARLRGREFGEDCEESFREVAIVAYSALDGDLESIGPGYVRVSKKVKRIKPNSWRIFNEDTEIEPGLSQVCRQTMSLHGAWTMMGFSGAESWHFHFHWVHGLDCRLEEWLLWSEVLSDLLAGSLLDNAAQGEAFTIGWHFPENLIISKSKKFN